MPEDVRDVEPGSASRRDPGRSGAVGAGWRSSGVAAAVGAGSDPGRSGAVGAGSNPGRSGAVGAGSRSSGVAAGARATAPLAIAVFAFGASFGILARDAGMGVAAPILMSVTTFAGSAQFAVASVLESGGAVVAAIMAAVLLNLRYFPIGMSVAPSLRGGPLRRAAESQLAVDESWAIAQEGGRVDRDRLIGAGLVLMVFWTSGTVAGVLGGSAIGDPADYGLDAMFPALFLALLAGQLTDGRTRAAALAGGVIALALTPVLPPGLPLVAATGGVVLALAVRR